MQDALGLPSFTLRWFKDSDRDESNATLSKSIKLANLIGASSASSIRDSPPALGTEVRMRG